MCGAATGVTGVSWGDEVRVLAGVAGGLAAGRAAGCCGWALRTEPCDWALRLSLAARRFWAGLSGTRQGETRAPPTSPKGAQKSRYVQGMTFRSSTIPAVPAQSAPPPPPPELPHSRPPARTSIPASSHPNPTHPVPRKPARGMPTAGGLAITAPAAREAPSPETRGAASPPLADRRRSPYRSGRGTSPTTITCPSGFATTRTRSRHRPPPREPCRTLQTPRTPRPPRRPSRMPPTTIDDRACPGRPMPLAATSVPVAGTARVGEPVAERTSSPAPSGTPRRRRGRGRAPRACGRAAARAS